jgi:menaquinone-dependent protoporphyrinogen IX oxidase
MINRKWFATIYMKIWPRKRWKQALFVFFTFVLAVVVILAIVGTYAWSAVNKDVVNGVEVINPSGSKTALVVYQAGLTAFPKDTSYAFANGLAASGWRVEVTSASSQAPSNLSKYDLLVLSFPIYGGKPGTTIVRYVDRMEDLHGMNAVIIALSGFNSTETSVDTMMQKVHAANGTVQQSLTLSSVITLFGIAPSQGNGSPADIARQAGTQIHP